MPNARTHDIITIATAAAANAAYFALDPRPEFELAALFTGSYLLAGFACAGDLDLDSKEYRRWGPLRFLWWPYMKAVPHRHWASHGLVAGGVIRLLYLCTVVTLLFWLAVWLYSRLGPHVDAGALTRAHWETAFSLAHAHPRHTVAFVSGFILAGTTHAVSDLISTWFKRRF